MRFAYASRTGNVKSIIDRLGIDAIDVSLSNGIDEDFILFTYTDGYGNVPYEVEDFLDTSSKHLKGVIVSGNKNYTDTYCMAGDVISKQYNVPVLYKVEDAGSDEDIAAIAKIINS
nr:class Ib ribonucleoside-diphosphate reductase assembly flavoprotein NrdI [Bacilli bacterium]